MARSNSDAESELERLDARADAVARDFSDDTSSFGSSDVDSSEADSEDDNAAAAAAVVPRKRAKRSEGARRPEDRNLEEDDGVLRAASWRDLEDTRKFLENDHRERFNVLISRWEGVEDGDDVDLNTGRVVVSKGHLDALAPQKNMAFFEDSDDDENDEESMLEEDDAGGSKGDIDLGIDPLFIVCQKPSPLLDLVITSM